MRGVIMKKATKGALAAGAAGSLLLGGAGSLAYWTDASPVTGGSITSGHLKLTGANCGAWKIDGGADYVAQVLVPGDSLTRHCTYTVDAAGDHLTATIDVTGGALTGTGAALISQLDLTGTSVTNGTDTVTNFPATGLAVVNGDTVTVDLNVSFPDSLLAGQAGNVSPGLTATLGAITVTAVQGHSA
jgi:alternate signal-mediated exported protein